MALNPPPRANLASALAPGREGVDENTDEREAQPNDDAKDAAYVDSDDELSEPYEPACDDAAYAYGSQKPARDDEILFRAEKGLLLRFHGGGRRHLQGGVKLGMLVCVLQQPDPHTIVDPGLQYGSQGQHGQCNDQSHHE